MGGGQDNSSVVVAQGTPSSPASFLLPSQKSALRCAHKAGIKRRRAHTLESKIVHPSFKGTSFSLHSSSALKRCLGCLWKCLHLIVTNDGLFISSNKAIIEWFLNWCFINTLILMLRSQRKNTTNRRQLPFYTNLYFGTYVAN